MGKDADVLDLSPLGVRVEIRRSADDTGGALVEFDVVGRAQGFLAQPHVHVHQTERLEVIAGSLELQVDGVTHVLGPMQSMEVAPGAVHRQRSGGDGDGRIRIQNRPARQTEGFLRRLAELCATGAFTKGGWPKPVAGAQIIRDFGAEAHASTPPLPVQRAFARTVLAVAASEYLFVDEWDVAAPPEAVFGALADGRTYPEWWRPVYLGIEADGPPAVGAESRQHFKGRLPYHLRTRSVITRCEAPRVLEVEVDGDLRGHGTWTLAPALGGTHVRFDWRVHADRRLLRVLTPVLRPLFRWNHNWAIARAMDGLEPYAQRQAGVQASEAA